MRPVAMRPTNSDYASDVTIICSGPSGLANGPGTWSRIKSKQRRDRIAGLLRIVSRIAVAAAGENVGEVERGVIGPQLDEQVERFRQRFLGRASGRSILLTTTIGFSPHFQGLLEHKPRLRPRAFEGIDQNQRPVGHLQHALDFAAEIGVAGRVDDVDLHALVDEGDVLGENGDAAFPFQIVGIEDAIPLELRLAELAALAATGNRPASFCRDRRGQ